MPVSATRDGRAFCSFSSSEGRPGLLAPGVGHAIARVDPAALMWSAVLLAVFGAFGAWLAAYRASSIDPAEVLREG